MLERHILRMLANSPDGLSGGEIWLSLPWWLITFSIYPCLYQMEAEGKIWSIWQSGPYPRKRIYHLDLNGVVGKARE